MLPGGIRPEIMLNGKLYYRDQFAYPMRTSISGEVYIDATGDTALPKGYTQIGQITSVTNKTPTENCWLKAGFSATGNIYANKDTPEVIYD